MKKLLAVLVIILLTHSSAMAATTVVSFNRAGARVSVARGASAPVSVHNFGLNAPTVVKRTNYGPYGHYMGGNYKRPCPNDRTGNRQMAMTRDMKMQQYGRSQNLASASKTAPIEVSRLNKNYTVQTQKSYSKNGITYYN